jgi:tetratricopeptide (TPR) repeat protein
VTTIEPRKERFAKDFASARPGEIVAHDCKGRFLSQARINRAKRTGGLIGAAAGVTVVVASAGAGGLATMFVAGIGLLVLGQVVRVRLRKYAALRKINALLMAGDRDGARAVLDTISARAPRPFEASRLAMEASLAYTFGDHRGAIERCERVIAMLPEPRFQVLREACHVSCAGAHAEMGDVARAREHRSKLDASRPRESLEKLWIIAVDAHIAFAADSPGDLPDDVTLHEWARLALEFHHSGGALVGLAWAFDRRGDAEMAELLLDAATDRSDASYFAEAYPRLEAWRRQRSAASPASATSP